MKFVGVDVSKDTLDICIIDNDKKKFYKIENKSPVINNFFLEFIDKKIIVAFETTSHYSDKIAWVLTDLNIDYRELSPLQISHILKFISAKKSDQIDSYKIALCVKKFNEIFKTCQYDSNYKLIQSYNSTLRLFTKIRTQLKNYKKSKDFVVDDNLTDFINGLDNYLKELDTKLLDLSFEILKNYIPNSDLIVKNCAGVGKKLAISLFPILHKNKDKNYKQVLSYLGLAPKIYQSGTSVRKKGSISKLGNSYIRSILFMSCLSAIRNNEIIKNKYNNLVSRGKNKKIAIVACMCAMIKWLKKVYFENRQILSYN